MDRLFIDTSAWFAYADDDDPDHSRVVAVLEEYRDRLVTSSYIFDETITLCIDRLGHRTAVETGARLLDPDVADLIRVEPADERAAWELFRNRPDKDYSFTDCTSFVLMRRLGIKRALALDEDFRKEGFEVAPA